MGKVTTGGKALMAMLVMMSLKKGIIGAKLLKIGDPYVGGHSVFSMWHMGMSYIFDILELLAFMMDISNFCFCIKASKKIITPSPHFIPFSLTLFPASHINYNITM